MTDRPEKPRRPQERRESLDRPGVDRRNTERREGAERRGTEKPVLEDRRSGGDRRRDDQRSGDERRATGDRRQVPERLNRVAAILLPRVLSPRDPSEVDSSEEPPTDFHDGRVRESLARQLRGE